MTQRNPNIEIARYVGAFMVICIHLTFPFGTYYLPLLRCAVPFFYIVTGYFLFSNDYETCSRRIDKSIKNYVWLWTSSLIIFSVLAISIRYFVNDHECFLWSDVIKFIKLGSCNYLSHITLAGTTFSISMQVWFLYSGMLALIFLKLNRKYWFSMLFNLIIAACAIIPILFSWAVNCRIAPVIYMSIPSIYAGICTRRFANTIDNIATNKWIFLAFVFLILSYVEYIILQGKLILDGTIFTIPLTIAVFILILRLPIRLNEFWGGVNKLPSQTTLDIYLWHQFIYMLLTGILKMKFYRFDALAVFIVCAFLSIVMRKLYNRIIV